MKERNRKEPTPMKMMRNIDIISDDVHAIILLSFMASLSPQDAAFAFFGNYSLNSTYTKKTWRLCTVARPTS